MGLLFFFFIFFNCKSKLRDLTKRPESLRTPLQVSYLRVLKQKKLSFKASKSNNFGQGKKKYFSSSQLMMMTIA